jgi:hypothetical protein
MFCKKCGKEVQEGVRFCPSCGAEVGSVNSEVENSAQKDNSINSTASGSTQQTQSVGSDFGSAASKVNINIPTSVKNVDSNSIKNLLKNKKFIGIVAAVIVVVILICAVGGDSTIDTVKDGTIAAYPYKTVGKAFDDFFTSPKWNSYKENGDEYVKFTGKYAQGKNTLKVTVIFEVNGNSFQIDSVDINGITYTSLYDLADLMDAIYGE